MSVLDCQGKYFGGGSYMGFRRTLGLVFSVAALTCFFFPVILTDFPREYYNPDSPRYIGVGRSMSYISFWLDDIFINAAFLMAALSALLALFGYSKLLIWTGLLLLLANFTGIGYLVGLSENSSLSSSGTPTISIQFWPLSVIIFASIALIIIGIAAHGKALRSGPRNLDRPLG